MDGNQQLNEDPHKLINTYLSGSTSFATYKHPDRSTLQEELDACIRMKKDHPAVMRTQLARYLHKGYPDDGGLLETTVVLRRNCSTVMSIDADWWIEIANGSLRDQLSLPYVLHSHDLAPEIVEGQRDKPVHFKYFAHR
jgi:hypothetical protein